ncbi:hypothetical protein CFC21_082766 [Triticum aestivum]|uniref:Uncharacterized protein n=2 Tax=Triticum aestivum TaxID=4565 RepID=A0A3B6FIT1_WHEAT|nr:hypothetical protein CFC21_082766 [Triticum aestivum]
MKKGGASSAAAMTAAGDAKEQHEGEARPPKQYTAAHSACSWALLAEARRYNAMEEEDVVDEYGRAGKLHTYDQDKEWKKRFARVVKLNPCPWPNHMVARIEEYMYCLEEDDDEFRIGLFSLIGEEIRG